MSDGAAGKDDVTIVMIRKCNPETQIVMAKKIKEMAGRNPDEWEKTIKEGVVIPLYKNKGKRNQMNNYRCICLLSMASRILVRVMASRIRDWSEEINLLDENQQGFRAGRSTADATQILVRMHEELINENIQSENSIKAILLDIQKAYPRINKSILWEMLKKFGMKETITILKGLHEHTTYEVRGREANSTTWMPLRGLREGCATSPGLFNVYQNSHKTRQERARQPIGAPWQWSPGNSSPPPKTQKRLVVTPRRGL